ncbi:MAG: transporter substrate-binding domain-containing protein [Pseudomonadota bacterium]
MSDQHSQCRIRRKLSFALLAAAALPFIPTHSRAAGSRYRIAYHEDFPPYSQRQDGAMRGIFINIMNELLVKRLGLEIDHEGFPWARAQQRVKEGKADAFVTVATDERRLYTVPTQEWVTQGRLAMFARVNEPERDRLSSVKEIAELKDYRIGTYLGNGWVKSRFAGIEVNYVVDRAAALKMLQAGRLQIVVDASNPTLSQIRAMGLEKEIVELPPILDVSETHLCISKLSPLQAHMTDIDLALRKMKSDGSLRKLSELI